MEIKQYQKKWLQHVQRMDTNRLPKQALQYKPKGRRNVGRPRKRDGGTNYILRIKEQETRLNLHEHHDDDDDEKETTCFHVCIFQTLTHSLDQIFLTAAPKQTLFCFVILLSLPGGQGGRRRRKCLLSLQYIFLEHVFNYRHSVTRVT